MPPNAPAPKLPNLSPEEMELAVWYADGVKREEMAAWRKCTVRTIARQLDAVHKTLAVDGLTVKRLLGKRVREVRTFNESLAKSL